MRKPLKNAMGRDNQRPSRWYTHLLNWLLEIVIIALVEMVLLYPLAVYLTPLFNGVRHSWQQLFPLIPDFFLALPRMHTWMSWPTLAILRELVVIWLYLMWPVNLIVFTLTLRPPTARNDRPFQGVEQGSAHWAGPEERREFQPRPGAIPIQHNLCVGPDNGLPNLHNLVIGGTGYGKTYFSLTPALLARAGSYLVADVKGALYTTTAHLMRESKYDVLVVNLKNPKYSDCFNPYAYIHSDTDIDRFVRNFILNTRDEGAGVGDQFWEDTINALYTSMSIYMLTQPGEKASLSRMLELVVGIKVVSGRVSDACFYHRCMTDRELDDPDDPAVKSYQMFLQGAGETLQSILISASMRLKLWATNRDIQMLTATDELHLRQLAQSKTPTVLYLILPESGAAMKPLSATLIQTVFSVFSDVALNECHGQLPVRWTFLFDEFANLGQFNDIVSQLTLVRAYGMAMWLYLQSIQQLQKLYKDQDQTIIGNCAIFLYLGSNDRFVYKEISDRLGSTTTYNDSTSHATSGTGNNSESTQNIGRPLLYPNEVGTKLKKRCIVQLPDHNPFIGEKVKTGQMDGSELLGREVKPNHEYEAYKNNSFIEDDYKDKYEARLEAFEQAHNSRLTQHQSMVAEMAEAMREQQEQAAQEAADAEAAAGKQPQLILGFDELEKSLGFGVDETSEPSEDSIEPDEPVQTQDNPLSEDSPVAIDLDAPDPETFETEAPDLPDRLPGDNSDPAQDAPTETTEKRGFLNTLREKNQRR